MAETFSGSGSGTMAKGPNSGTDDQLAITDRIKVTYSNLSSHSTDMFGCRKKSITV
jgi:hypothetical protein